MRYDAFIIIYWNWGVDHSSCHPLTSAVISDNKFLNFPSTYLLLKLSCSAKLDTCLLLLSFLKIDMWRCLVDDKHCVSEEIEITLGRVIHTIIADGLLTQGVSVSPAITLNKLTGSFFTFETVSKILRISIIKIIWENVYHHRWYCYHIYSIYHDIYIYSYPTADWKYVFLQW